MWYSFNLFIKRLADIVLSVLGIVFLMPLFFVIAIVIKADSKGPVLFSQSRRTTNGRLFNMYKFRTMITDAEHMDSGLFSYESDSRVTRSGRFLRTTSLDELPQLFNILMGDMSIVGPRPCVSYELGDFDTLNKRYKKRFQVKAGLTGLAQVNGRNDISWDDKVTYDNQYVDLFRKKGVLIDIAILFGSVLKVFRKEDIYESKIDGSLDDAAAAKIAEEEIIRRAHQPD